MPLQDVNAEIVAKTEELRAAWNVPVTDPEEILRAVRTGDKGKIAAMERAAKTHYNGALRNTPKADRQAAEAYIIVAKRLAELRDEYASMEPATHLDNAGYWTMTSKLRDTTHLINLLQGYSERYYGTKPKDDPFHDMIANAPGHGLIDNILSVMGGKEVNNIQHTAG